MEKRTDPLNYFIELAWRRFLQESAMDTGMRDVFAAGYRAAYERHHNVLGLVDPPEQECQSQRLQYLEGGHSWWGLVDGEVAGSRQRERGIVARPVARNVSHGQSAINCREIINFPWQFTGRDLPSAGSVNRVENRV